MREGARADVRELHEALRELLEMELAAGNRVADSWRAWPDAETIAVVLAKPFRPATKAQATERQSLVYDEIDDPHYWNEEIVHWPSRHLWSPGGGIHRSGALSRSRSKRAAAR